MQNSKVKMQNLEKKHYKKGMSLVELIVYLSITMLISVLIIELTSRVLILKTQSAGSAEVAANASLIINRLSYEITNAKAIIGDYPADSLNLDVKGVPVTIEFISNQLLCGGEPLNNDLVEIDHTTSEPLIFTRIVNGNATSVQISFKVKSKNSNFSRDYKTSFLVEGR